jgi:hypothetical protein
MELVFVKPHRRRQMVAVSERTRDRPSGFHFETLSKISCKDDQENVCETRWDHRTPLADRKSAVTVDEHLASAAGNVERAELDEEREINRNERKYWKNDKMVGDYAFAIPKRVAASSIVTFKEP